MRRRSKNLGMKDWQSLWLKSNSLLTLDGRTCSDASREVLYSRVGHSINDLNDLGFVWESIDII